MKFEKQLFLKIFEKNNYDFSQSDYACLNYNNISDIIDFAIDKTCKEIILDLDIDIDYYEEFNDEINELRAELQYEAINKVNISYKKLDIDFRDAFENAKKQSDDNDIQIYIRFVKIIEKNENIIVKIWHVEQNDIKSKIERESIKSICYKYYLDYLITKN